MPLLEADIIQTTRCNVCKMQRIEDAIIWWEVWSSDNHFIFAKISLPVVKTKAYVCGIEHLFKLLNEVVREN